MLPARSTIYFALCYNNMNVPSLSNSSFFGMQHANKLNPFFVGVRSNTGSPGATDMVVGIDDSIDKTEDRTEVDTKYEVMPK